MSNPAQTRGQGLATNLDYHFYKCPSLSQAKPRSSRTSSELQLRKSNG